MKILTNRNGIALVAVLTLLLILTLLLPAMFTMTDSATKSAMRGNDELRASYLARTMIEMSVSAFTEAFDSYEEAMKTEDFGNPDYKNMNSFLTLASGKTENTMDASTLYMFSDSAIPYPVKPKRADFDSEEEYNSEMMEYEQDLYNYSTEGTAGVIYTTELPTGQTKESLEPGLEYTVSKKDSDGNSVNVKAKFIGYSDCKVTYVFNEEFYKIEDTGEYTPITKSEYENKMQALKEKISKGQTASESDQYFKTEAKTIKFQAHASVNGKGGIRNCVMVLPTKPAENNWIVPAEIESNQIFPNTSKATGIKTINYSQNRFTDGKALQQPVYIFSCIGNMVISPKNLMAKITDSNGNVSYTDYAEYCKANHINYSVKDLSLGAHPITTTVNPSNDPTFSCIKTNNMKSWASSAQLDNFIAFTATNAIQVDMPVNLLINPCRTMRIGDGFDNNQSLYKMMYFQAPTIIFNGSVNNFVSLYQKYPTLNLLGVSDYDAYRMSSIVLAAPESTPFSYDHDEYGPVKAGKVFFAEDAYIWLVPFTENGSSLDTQTVYYKGSDIILYKIANAGDIYYFNSEVKTTRGTGKTGADGKEITESVSAGFSLTGYFLDTRYNDGAKVDNNNWYNVWSNIQQFIFNEASNAFRERTYVKDDFRWVGNVYANTGEPVPSADDVYVVWDS